MRLWKRQKSESRREERIAPLLYPERIVSREYYGAVLGRRFDSDMEAAEFYLSDGWRNGVVPHPFLNFAMARSSMDAAITLRNMLRDFASAPDARVDLAGIGPLVDRGELSKSGLAAGADDVARLLRLDTGRSGSVRLRGGSTWAEAKEFFSQMQEQSKRVREAGFFDLEFYSAQRPRPFLTWEAAFDDYLVDGERSGVIPDWAFEPEWHAVHDASQQRHARPLNQLLWYVAHGEQASTFPLGESAEGRTVALGDILGERADEEILSRGDVSVSWADARRAVEDSFVVKPVTVPPRRVPLRGSTEVDIAVIVDARHLATDAQIADLHRLATTQRVNRRSIYVVSDAADGHEPPLHVRLAEEERLWIVASELGEPFGSAAARILQEQPHDAWTLWRPGQVWKEDGLIATGRALSGYPDAGGVGAATPDAPQDWGDPQAGLWRARLDAAGIVFRSSQILPDPDRDYGVNADAVYRLGLMGTGIVIEGDRFWARHYDAATYANRAAANSARATHSLVPENTLPENVAVTVVVPTFQDWRMTLDAVRAVRDTSDAGVIIVDNGSRRAVGSILRTAFIGDPYVQYVRLPLNADFGAGSHLGARIATSETVVFLNNDTLVQDGWLAPLIDALKDAAAVQPVLTYADGTVQAAGTVFSGGLSMPIHLLSGHHPEDLPSKIADYPLSAVTAACVAMRREDYIAAGGFDPEYVNGMEDIDLSLRLRRATGRPLRTAVTSRVRHLESKTPGRFAFAMHNRVRFAQLWRDQLLNDLDDREFFEDTPFRLDSMTWRADRGGNLREVDWHVVRRDSAMTSVKERPEQLRWSLKIATPGTLLGDRWGDTFFAEGLAAALRALGQHVVIDRHSSWARPGIESDDVALVLRGLHRFTPLPTAVNLMWVISHPDQVSVDEVRSGWDRVYSAGPQWGEEMARRSGVDVATLLQATDSDRFQPVDDDAEPAGVLFVGRTRGERRRVVIDAAEVADDLEVYGDDGWEQYIDRRFIRGKILPNAALPRAYQRARVVLNDHWEDMRRGGFISNRLFDAAATGTPIVSDDIAGVGEVFGSQVRTYVTRDELRELLEPGSRGWPSLSERRANAARIRADHSFRARAEVLLEDAMRSRKSGGAS